MSEPFLGEIRLLPFNFAPRGWAFCDGQLMAISNNTALFSLLGTTYGGDGRSTFALPDLRGRTPTHVGASTGPGLTPRTLGETGGEESVTLIPSQMPAHSHPLAASTAPGDSQSPSGTYLATDATASMVNYSTTANAQMAAGAISPSGGSQPHDNMPPFLALNFCIATEGIYPTRS